MKKIFFALAAVSCLSIARAADSNAVHSITLPVLPPQLPDGPGQKIVLDRCTQCHTTRYILMQPRFSKEFWTTEVAKMKKTYGAPIADDQVEDIVNYLFAIRGK